MKKLLTTSALVLTVALAGMAYANDKDADHKDWHGGPPPFMEKAIDQLPKDKAEAFHDAMKKAHEKNEKLAEQAHKLHDDLRSITTAEKFDKAAFLAKNAELQKLHEQMRNNMTESFADALSSLSQADRKTLSDNMHPPGHGEHKHSDAQAAKSDKPADDDAGQPSPDKDE